MALLLGYLAAGRGRLRQRQGRELITVAAAGAAALLLSLGPTLKIGQIQPGLDASLLRLPTAWLYEHLPGISDMRATNRWLIVTRMVCIFLASAGLSVLWHRWRGSSHLRGTAIVILAGLTMLETMPNLWNVVQERQKSIERVQFLRDGIVAEADDLLVKNEVVLMLPSTNDFLANFLVPMTGTRSYNVGGDKNYGLSVSEWPEPVVAARNAYGPKAADALCHALASDVDAIVLPYMSPYYGALLFGNDPAAEAKRKAVALQLAHDPRFHAQVGKWLTVLRGANPSCSRS